MIGKHFTETSNKVEFQTYRVRINRALSTDNGINDNLVLPFICSFLHHLVFEMLIKVRMA